MNMRAIDRAAARDRKRNKSRRFPRTARRRCFYCSARTTWVVYAGSATCRRCGAGWIRGTVKWVAAI